MSTTRLPTFWTRLKPSSGSVSKVKKAVRLPLPQTAVEYLRYIPGSTILSLSKPSKSQRLDIVNYKNEETKARLEIKMKSNVPREELHWTEALTSEIEIESAKKTPILKGNNNKEVKKKVAWTFVEDDADEKMKYYVAEIQKISNRSGLVLKHLENLSDLILKFPHTKEYALKKGLDKSLLFIKRSNIADDSIKKASDKVLVLLGHVKPVGGNGIRILSVDGGGVRGLVAIELLRQIEQQSGKKIYELFDYVCGVSTGALLVAMLCVYKVGVNECVRLYKEFSSQMFDRSRLVGASNLVMSLAYYDTDAWEEILKANMGYKTFLEAALEDCPKFSALSAVVSQTPVVNFLFRNYNYGRGVKSAYPGTIDSPIWTALRASSAAPGYYRELKLENNVHQDGGLLTNNPTAIAIHEAKLLWPKESLQCVISLGTGRYKAAIANTSKSQSISLKTKLGKFVESATDTFAVHTTLQDLLPSDAYFRFNPPLTHDVPLDENRPDIRDSIISDASRYAHINSSKVEKAVESLIKPRGKTQKVCDWVKEKQAVML